MQILLLLGLVVVGASIALIYMQKGEDDKEKSFISKILGSFTGGSQEQKSNQPASKNDKYEKSADGKVVYIFKNNSDNDEEDDSESDDDSEVPENLNPDIRIVDAEVTDATNETDADIDGENDSDE